MKKLTRMKLINWHRFVNTTIDFGSSTLISGENGAGKTTILDAIQFVVNCSANTFNNAAHENGKRKLTGYIRCKTGRESRPYERTGSISAHIALEFFEETRNRYFIIGAVVDSASEGQETTVRYLIDNEQLSDSMFLDGDQVRSISAFRSHNPTIRQWCKTLTEARKMVLSRLGRIEDKFFRLIPKALAFKPIDDIKDFVYSYVLDEKEVNIDLLRENVRTYQDLERTLESVKTQMTKLEQIETFHKEAADCEQKDRMYDYFLRQAELDITKETIRTTQESIGAEEYRLQETQKELGSINSEWKKTQELETNLRLELKQNQDFLALEAQQKERERLQAEEKRRLEEKKELLQSVRLALDETQRLLRIDDADACIENYRTCLLDVENTSIPELKQLTDQVIRHKNERYALLQKELAELQIEQNQNRQKRDELQQKIQRLEEKKLTYPAGVERLMHAVKEEFARIGRKAEPHVLCELLEIQDETWRNAVEGYLNTQRFYILVEPENFDIALGVYDRLRKEKKAFGVGLINTQRMEHYEEAPAGTLAAIVASQNQYARRYVGMVLGKVQMCDRYEDLKKYPISITRECMRYQNRVASAIKPEVFQVPYIGRHAFRVQLEQAKREKETLNQAISALEDHLSAIKEGLLLLGTETDVDLKYRLDVLNDLKILRSEIETCDANIRTLKENSTLIQKQIQLEALERQVQKYRETYAEKNKMLGMIEQLIRDKNEQKEVLLRNQMQLQTAVEELAASAGDLMIAWRKEYQVQTRQKSYEQFLGNYDRRRKANETTRKKAEDQMIDRMIAYKTEHDFGAAPSMEGYPEFAAVYERLRTSELLEYEGKVQSARNAAEEEFREQFLAKLQENMKQAQGEFRELNKALKGIDFSNERYEFLFMPSKRFRNYYEMIMDDFNVIQGTSIFSGVFHENHREVIDELFDRLTLNDEGSAKTLSEFTDYRTYMDYDIKITHTDESYSFYSKVCEEKSGGETQTPFYVTVAASFVQLYGNNIGGEAAGLIMFDEAFNNMDDERISGVLEFLNRLPLQIIIAAPPDKIQYIGPSVEETLLVMTNEKTSFVEKYHHAI